MKSWIGDLAEVVIIKNALRDLISLWLIPCAHTVEKIKKKTGQKA